MFIKATLWRLRDYYSRPGAVYCNKEGNKKFLLWYQFCACTQETWDAITPVIRMNRSWISGLCLFWAVMMTYLFVFKVIERHGTCCGSVKYTKDLRRSWCGKPNCCNQLVLSLLFSLIYDIWGGLQQKVMTVWQESTQAKKHMTIWGCYYDSNLPSYWDPSYVTYTSHNLKLQPPLS